MMDAVHLTGAQRVRLRGIGQRMAATIKLGKAGLTPGLLAEMRRQIGAHELVKLRFVGLDRSEKDALCLQIEKELPCICVGAVGHTALFYLRNPEGGVLGEGVGGNPD
jgi:RNA-binding protein